LIHLVIIHKIKSAQTWVARFPARAAASVFVARKKKSNGRALLDFRSSSNYLSLFFKTIGGRLVLQSVNRLYSTEVRPPEFLARFFIAMEGTTCLKVAANSGESQVEGVYLRFAYV
jgi:hypothetical protein